MSRLADVLLASVMLVLTFPLLFIVSLAIKWGSTGPVLERELCVGCRGRRFQLLRFRTTVHVPHDPRSAWSRREITTIGVFLRYTRIDHLPQLLNVLRGDMSLVDMDGRSPSFLE
jgi:lipopolysaccharide/colanic/teichoic acid biosynthesis glycosyltransferase